MLWKLAMCWLYAITKYRYTPNLEEILSAIEDAKRLGFRYMELEGVGDQLHMVSDNQSLIKKKCEREGIEIIDFVPVLPDLMSTNEERRRKALNDFRIGCEVASYFESSVTQVDTFHLPIHTEIPYDITEDFKFAYQAPSIRVDPDFDFWAYFYSVLVSSVGECNDIAGNHGLKLCVEPRTWENISNAWALELLMREVNSDNLGAVLDVAHLSAQKMSIVQCIEMLGKRIFYVHASDNTYLTEDHLEVGKGMVDWQSMFRVLKKHAYSGYIGIDIGGKPELKQNLDSIYVNSKRYLERLMRDLETDRKSEQL
ncbi:MAG: sugar phosphate isomerase/epimerase [Candidatus Bathyarchaeota archaeon]|nr:sugar phosphate isomerase/epimerase [Candidatus Bathyarchaeota archaeon]